jgi:hypothetical protein
VLKVDDAFRAGASDRRSQPIREPTDGVFVKVLLNYESSFTDLAILEAH